MTMDKFSADDVIQRTFPKKISCIHEMFDMIVAILAVLKTGCAYVPIDPKNPAERLAYIIGDAEVPVLITRTGLLDSIPDHVSEPVFLDRECRDTEKQSGENLNIVTSSDSLAYVIYTSGSTGQPKGVMVTHLNVYSFVVSFW
jgi:non-ribosomal peptide synthetase component F